MPTRAEVQEWLQKMGYNGKMPEAFGNLCNPSTSVVWNQIISNIKPRQEVQHIKKNIIISRLQKKPLDQQNKLDYPTKELEAYKKKVDLLKTRTVLENEVNEKEAEIDKVSKENNKKYILIDQTAQKVRENKERTHLLNKKITVLSEQLRNVEEMSQNLAPIDLTAQSDDSAEVTETFQKCSDKLEKHFESLSSTNSINSTIAVHQSSSLLSTRTSNRTLGYPSRTSTARKYYPTSVVSERKPPKSAKSLFLAESSNKENHDFSGCHIIVENWDVSNEKGAKPRESLGLLPNCVLNAANTDDGTFLTSDNICFRKCFEVNDSIPNTTVQSSDLSKAFKGNPAVEATVKKLFGDEFVTKTVEHLLHTQSRGIIMKSCKSINERIMSDLSHIILEYVGIHNDYKMVGKEDLTELYAIHLKKELEKIKHRRQANILQERFTQSKEVLIQKLTANTLSETKIQEITRLLDLQLKDVELDSRLNLLRKEIDSSQKSETSNELEVVTAKIRKTNEDIGSKMARIEDAIEYTGKILQVIKRVREETLSRIRRLNNFNDDMCWVAPLKDDTFSNEIRIFQSYPLEYCRRNLDSDDKEVSYRSIRSGYIPSNITLDSNNLNIFASLIEHPFRNLEQVVLNIVQMRFQLEVLRGVPQDPIEYHGKKCCLKELQSQEGYIEEAINKMNCLISSSSAKQVLSLPKITKKMMELWIEMPFRHFISEKRLVDGHNYKFYEDKFNLFYKDL